jgi:hypothetical protein
VSGNEKREQEAALRRLEQLISALDEHPDPAARNPARELVELVLDLHGVGLAKLLATVAAADGGATILARLADDDQVRSLLLLHGLHPEDLESRVRKAVDRLRPHLGIHGLRLEVAEIVGGVARLRVYQSSVAVNASLLWSLPGEIEDAIIEAAPDIENIVIEGLDMPSAVAMARASARRGEDERDR